MDLPEPPEFEEIHIWVFDANDDACDLCKSLEGAYEEEPARPHDDCRCSITEGDVKATKVGEHREIEGEYEDWESVGLIPEGGSFTAEKNWSTGEEDSMEGGIEAEGVSFGLGHTETESEGGAESVTFNYDSDKGGKMQEVFAVYLYKVWEIVETWLAHWSEGMGPDFEFEVIRYDETRSFDRYEQVPL